MPTDPIHPEPQGEPKTPEQQDDSGRNEDGTFKPGVSGNLAGRPKFSIVSILREKLLEVPTGQKSSRAQQLVDEILDKAIIDKDTAMMRDILDRIDGKPKQAITGGDEDDKPIAVRVVYE